MPKIMNEYYCIDCDYKCYKKSSMDKHNLTDKHSRATKKSRKVSTSFECKMCNFICKKESNYKRHLLTNKHLHLCSKTPIVSAFISDTICAFGKGNCYHALEKCEGVVNSNIQNKNTTNDTDSSTGIDIDIYANLSTENIIINNKNCNCECGKSYKTQRTLSFHKKTCEVVKSKLNALKEKATHINDDTFSSIMGEIKTLMAEQNKMNQIITELANKPALQNNSITNTANITNNNTNNHQFNMNMFLNETCKDAMNMSEFIENLTVTMEDMEMTGTLGFAKGMSRIIMNNLNALEVHKRPIHCSDAKRETLYVKNNGVWEKDTDDKKHTKELIYKVSSLNLKHLLKWRDLPRNKGYDNPDHKKNDEFTILVMEINKVKIEEIEKVVTIISKHVTIDKNKVRMSGYLN